MTLVYILIAVGILAVLYFVTRKAPEPTLPAAPVKEPKRSLPQNKDEGDEQEEEEKEGEEKEKPQKADNKPTASKPPPKVSSQEKAPSHSAQESKEAKEGKPSKPPHGEVHEKPAQPTDTKSAATVSREAEKPVEAPKSVKSPSISPVVEEKRIPKAQSIDDDFGGKQSYDPIVVRQGLSRTRGGLIGRLVNLFRGKKEIEPALLHEIEEVLLTSDCGVKTTQRLVESLHERLKNKELSDEDKVWAALRAEAESILRVGEKLKLRAKPSVVMLVGVNGSGKTTTIGKLTAKLKAQGKKVLLGAGDTFRAAAVQQLEAWGQREGAEVVKGKEKAEPGGVLFEAVNKGKEQGFDVVLCDTAGRLHTKSGLMEELARVQRALGKSLDGAPHETWLVLDATNGQNALEQAKQFKEAIQLTGIILTKLDGTAKGGVILSIVDELKLPVRFIGIGEKAADLREFDPGEFVEALFASREAVDTEAA